MDEQKTIFGIEEKALEKAQTVLKDPRYQDNPLLTEFAALLDYYKRMYEQFRRLIKISDSQQLQLKRAHEQIEVQKRLLEEQNKKLVEAARLREDVERITRHDLKSPLSAVISLPSLLAQNPSLTESERNQLKMIADAGRTMLNMINLSLDMFKMEYGAYQFQPVPVNIVGLIQKIATETYPLRQAKQLGFETFLAGQPVKPEGSLFAVGEELLCYSMLSNLIKNAIEASPEGGDITVNIELHNAAVQIRIHNQGAVPEAIRDRFFQKYVTSGKPFGTGLGAYSAKLFAATQQGDISMTTSDADGTTITIRLPGSNFERQEQEIYAFPPGALDVLPPDLLAEFRHAVIIGDYTVILDLIERIRPYHPAFAESVADLAKEFRLGVLYNFLEAHKHTT